MQAIDQSIEPEIPEKREFVRVAADIELVKKPDSEEHAED
jgi:hypothetical protein